MSKNLFDTAMEAFALLFVYGDTGVKKSTLIKSLNIDASTLNEVFDILSGILSNHTPLKLIDMGDTFTIGTREEFGELITRILPHKSSSYSKLSQQALETLAIIAYRQPIYKEDIEKIRGDIDSRKVLGILEERGFIRGALDLEKEGRPIFYRTTEFFLKYFGLSDLSELPNIQYIKENF